MIELCQEVQTVGPRILHGKHATGSPLLSVRLVSPSDTATVMREENLLFLEDGGIHTIRADSTEKVSERNS